VSSDGGVSFAVLAALKTGVGGVADCGVVLAPPWLGGTVGRGGVLPPVVAGCSAFPSLVVFCFVGVA